MDYKLKTRLDLFFENQYLSIFGLFVSNLFLYYFLDHTFYDYIFWISLTVLVLIPRILIIIRYKQNKINLKNVENIYSFLIFLNASIQAFIVYSNFPSDILSLIIIIMIISGQTAGSLIGNGFSKKAIFCFLFPSLVGLSLTLYFMIPNFSISILSFLVLLYFLILMRASSNFRKVADRLWTLENKLNQEFKFNFYNEVIKGMSHEINNNLMKIKMANYFLENDNYKDQSLIINESIKKINSIIGGFNHTDTLNNENFSVYDILKEIKQEVKKAYVEILLECDFNLYANKVLFKRSILNLVENSIDSMNNINEKVVSFTINKGIIEVTDQGDQIDADIVDKIMMPFFTTKKIGENTGIGLTMSKKYLNSINLSLELDTNDYKTFRIMSKN